MPASRINPAARHAPAAAFPHDILSARDLIAAPCAAFDVRRYRDPYPSPGRGEIVKPGNTRSQKISEKIERRHDADHQHADAHREPEGEPLLDDVAHLLALAVGEQCGQAEP